MPEHSNPLVQRPPKRLGAFWQQWQSILMLVIIIVQVCISLVLTVYVANYFQLFTNALQAMNAKLFYENFMWLCLTLLANMLNKVALDWLVWQCRIRWRSFLSLSWVEALYESYMVLSLHRFCKTIRSSWYAFNGANHDQRFGRVVQKDLSNATDVIGFMVKSMAYISDLVVYSYLLYQASPNWRLVTGVVIPHYLLWVAWISGVVIGGVPVIIEALLAQDTGNQQDSEHQFYTILVAMESGMHSILNTTGLTKWYKRHIEDRFKRVISTMQILCLKTIMFDFMQSIVKNLIWLLPPLILAPLIFKGRVTVGAYLVASGAFSFIVLNIKRLLKGLKREWAKYRAMRSITKLHKDAVCVSRSSTAMQQQCIKEDASVFIDVRVSVDPPSGQSYDVGFLIQREEDLLGKIMYLKAPAGMGKTQLLSVLSGVRVGLKRVVPKGYTFFYLPQKPARMINGVTVKDYLKINQEGMQDSTMDVKPALYYLSKLDLDQHGNKKALGELAVNSLAPCKRQQLDLARAALFCDEKTILVADKPFASMDTKSARLSKEFLQEQLKNKKMAGMITIDLGYKSKMELLTELLRRDKTALGKDAFGQLKQMKSELSKQEEPSNIIEVNRIVQATSTPTPAMV